MNLHDELKLHHGSKVPRRDFMSLSNVSADELQAHLILTIGTQN